MEANHHVFNRKEVNTYGALTDLEAEQMSLHIIRTGAEGWGSNHSSTLHSRGAGMQSQLGTSPSLPQAHCHPDPAV